MSLENMIQYRSAKHFHMDDFLDRRAHNFMINVLTFVPHFHQMPQLLFEGLPFHCSIDPPRLHCEDGGTGDLFVGFHADIHKTQFQPMFSGASEC